MTHGQYDARSTITFPDKEHCHCPLVVPHRVGGWVGPSAWLHTKTVYSRTVTYLGTNRAQRRVTLLMPNRHVGEVKASLIKH